MVPPSARDRRCADRVRDRPAAGQRRARPGRGPQGIAHPANRPARCGAGCHRLDRPRAGGRPRSTPDCARRRHRVPHGPGDPPGCAPRARHAARHLSHLRRSLVSVRVPDHRGGDPDRSGRARGIADAAGPDSGPARRRDRVAGLDRIGIADGPQHRRYLAQSASPPCLRATGVRRLPLDDRAGRRDRRGHVRHLSPRARGAAHRDTQALRRASHRRAARRGAGNRLLADGRPRRQPGSLLGSETRSGRWWTTRAPGPCQRSPC